MAEEDTSNRTMINVIGDFHAGQATTVAWDAGSVFITSSTSTSATSNIWNSYYDEQKPQPVLEETDDEVICGDAFIR